jgi:hypothetical protein
MDTNDVKVVVVDAKVSKKKSKVCCEVLCKHESPSNVASIQKMIKILVIGMYVYYWTILFCDSVGFSVGRIDFLSIFIFKVQVVVAK